ncbi:MAG: hypothetical protein Q3M24_10005 [Candidatus Electrothrix aestuarii]|uniref:Uncharacterized protein n=1 Tax=Candidatus Electrothrix aestuarii TaxID=3062594 RepID=A0AAU8M0L7_9BACT
MKSKQKSTIDKKEEAKPLSAGFMQACGLPMVQFGSGGNFSDLFNLVK